MAMSLYFMLVLIIGSSKLIECEFYHITPSLSEPCPVKSCLTLSQFAANTSSFLDSNTTLIFLAGNHSLEWNLTVSMVWSFAMLSNDMLEESSSDSNETRIACELSTMFVFSDINDIHISGIQFLGCSGNRVEYVPNCTVDNCGFYGEGASNRTALTLIETTAMITSTSFISNSNLFRNNRDVLLYFWNFVTTSTKIGVGGAIVASQSKMSIVTSQFEGNRAVWGGAIYSEKNSVITVTNSTFLDNHGVTQLLYSGEGAAMYLKNSTLNSSHVLYERNSAALGGVLRGEKSTIINSRQDHFYSNDAWQGGVISAHGTKIESKDNYYYNNSAQHGGVMYVFACPHVYSTNDYFYNNNARYTGGVFLAFQSSLNSKYNQFKNNTADRFGGVMYAEYSTLNSNGDNFYDNDANDNGGVVFMTYSSILNSHNNTFTRNRAGKSGGVMNAERSTLNISYNHFDNNSAGESGGVVTARISCKLHINTNYFYNNKADGEGGVLTASQDCKLNSLNNTFYSNTAGKKGGVMWVKKNTTINSMDDYFHKNRAGRRGGTVCLSRSTMNSSSSHFSNSRAGRKGGVLYAKKSMVTASGNTFYNNRAHRSAGVMWLFSTTVYTHNGNFSNNAAKIDGGAVVAYFNSKFLSEGDLFHSNTAGFKGGSIHVFQESKFFSRSGQFYNNTAGSDGGCVSTYNSMVTSHNDNFGYNSAGRDGGVIHSHSSTIDYEMITAHRNSAGGLGGVFRLHLGMFTMNNGHISSSSAKHGGVMSIDRLLVVLENNITISDAKAEMGGVLYVSGSDLFLHRHAQMTLLHNTAAVALVYFMDNIVHFHGNITFKSNSGSLVAITSQVFFSGYITFNSGRLSDHESIHKLEEGGAVTAIKSTVVFDGVCRLSDNQAKDGGAIRSIKSTIKVRGQVSIENNSATVSGGGIYLYQSELTCQHQSQVIFQSNTATTNGGGIAAISSSINIKNNGPSLSSRSNVHFIRNRAELGGGIHLQSNSVVYIMKYEASTESYYILNFTANLAHYGGAAFIADNTNFFGVCTEFENETHSVINECPFQILSLYGTVLSNVRPQSSTNNRNIYFLGNSAEISGSSLYGNFLETCTLSNLAESNSTNDNIIDDHFPLEESQVQETSYLKDISDIQNQEIGTPPVKVCFCKDNKPDCTYQHPQMYADRRKTISIALFDVVDNIIVGNADVKYYLQRKNNGSFIHVDKLENVNTNCTAFTFSAFSIHQFDTLFLRADPGPCEHSALDQIQLTLEFPWCENCPIGFQRFDDQELGCRCDCDTEIQDHFTNCNATTKTLQKTSSAWISYVNGSGETSGFIIRPHCPLDYCKPTDSFTVFVNFSEVNGADAQCADNRSGTLCSTCSLNLSLSLGSSRCLSCPKLWPILTAVLILLSCLSGIALVALLLSLNLTVAVGTVNGIVFYANIVAANSKVLLPFTKPNFATVFIAWLNLEFGIDACFFEGMDVYWKTWLQIAFPAYVIFLVIMVIIISERSLRFAHLIGKRNPIATLTTLVLLSYAKFLHTIIAAFSRAVLMYPDGSWQTVWLPDGTISYFSKKHTTLFIAAVFILVLGIAYTILLFLWQWLLCYQHKAVFKWVRNQKLCQFLEPYHAPYKFKHRYWTGLLLIVRVVLYTVSAVNVSGDPRVALVSTICLVGFLPLFKALLAIRVYKSTPIDLMETLIYFNLIFLSVFSWYSLETRTQTRAAIAYTSVSVTFLLLIVVLIYHVYKYTSAFSKLQKSTSFKTFLVLFQVEEKEQAKKIPDKCNDPLELDDILMNRVEPTYSVVEIHKPKVHQKPDHVEHNDLNTIMPISNLGSNVYTLTVDSHNVVAKSDESADEAPNPMPHCCEIHHA